MGKKQNQDNSNYMLLTRDTNMTQKHIYGEKKIFEKDLQNRW